jgi:predicted HAD superfamily Cof-like phosphohydrolase
MVNFFADHSRFMKACDQTIDGTRNEDQYALYRNLIVGEVKELNEAVENDDHIEQHGALIDILVVTIEAIHSMCADAEGAWKEVLQSKLAKIDPATGKFLKREGGKVLKPEALKGPVLVSYLGNY